MIHFIKFETEGNEGNDVTVVHQMGDKEQISLHFVYFSAVLRWPVWPGWAGWADLLIHAIHFQGYISGRVRGFYDFVRSSAQCAIYTQLSLSVALQQRYHPVN